jgi:hypothetical protein
MKDNLGEGKKVELGRIRKNASLAVGCDEPKAAGYAELVLRWGNFVQLLAWEQDGIYVNLEGQAKLKALEDKIGRAHV